MLSGSRRCVAASHGLLLREGRSWGGGGGEAGVGVHGLVGGRLGVGVLRQEGDGRVGRRVEGLTPGQVLRVALVAHVLGRVQGLCRMVRRVLSGGGDKRGGSGCCQRGND